jgi:hypothetical protein
VIAKRKGVVARRGLKTERSVEQTYGPMNKNRM